MGSVVPRAPCAGGGGVRAPCWIPLTIDIFPAIQDLKMRVLNYNQAVWMNNQKHPLDLIIAD